MAGIIFFCIYKYIKELSPVPVLSYLIFFSTAEGGITYVRTVVATCVIMYSFTYVSEKRLIPYCLCVLLAGSIHTSAYMAFPVYWVYNNEIRYKYYILTFVCCTLFFYFSGKLFLSNFSLFGEHFNYVLNYYIGEDQESDNYQAWGISVESALFGHLIKKIFLLYFLLKYLRERISDNKTIRGLLNVYIFSSIFYCSVVPVALQFGRMSGLFDSVDVILFAYTYKYIKDSKVRLCFLYLTILFCYFRISGHVLPNISHVYNYHTIFEI